MIYSKKDISETFNDITANSLVSGNSTSATYSYGFVQIYWTSGQVYAIEDDLAGPVYCEDVLDQWEDC